MIRFSLIGTIQSHPAVSTITRYTTSFVSYVDQHLILAGPASDIEILVKA